MDSNYNNQKFNLVISEKEKDNFELICNKLTKSIIDGRENPNKLDHKLLKRNRKIILEKLDNIEGMVNEMILLDNNKLKVLASINDEKLVEHFNIIKFTGSSLDIFKRWVDDAKKAFSNIIDSAQELALEAASVIEDATTQAYNAAKGSIQRTFNEALNQATGLINDARDIAVDIYNDTSELAINVVNDAKDIAITVVNDVYAGLETAWSAVTDTFYMLAGALTDFVGDIGGLGEKLLGGLIPKKVKRKNIKDSKTKASMVNSPHKIPLNDYDEELTSADISTNTLISKEAIYNLNKIGVTVKDINFDQKTVNDNIDSSIKDINELNIPGVKYNEKEWNNSKNFDGNLGECKDGACLEKFSDINNNLKPYNYFNNYSLV